MLPYTVDFEISQQEDGSGLRPIQVPQRRGSSGLMFQDRAGHTSTPIPDIVLSFAQQQMASPPGHRRNSSSSSPVNTFFYQYAAKQAEHFGDLQDGPSSASGMDTQTKPNTRAKPKTSPDFVKDLANNNTLEPLATRGTSAHGHRRGPLQPPSRAVSPAPSQSIVDTRRPVSPHTQPMIKIGRHKSRSRRGSMARDEVVFDRANFQIESQTGGNGGLKNAVQRADQEGRMETKVWIGTLGMPTDVLSQAKKNAIEEQLMNDYNSVPVFPNDSTYEGHYTHYCKQILWPTFHYQIPDNPKSKAYEDHSWEYYKELNQLFASKICESYKDDNDIIFINDYHLLLVPAMVRQKLPNAKIGFFLHVAFPSSEVFRCLAMRKELLEGVLGANCIGFQIPEYSRHFLQTCNRILAADTSADSVRTEGNIVSVVDCAIGIDPLSLDIQVRSDEVTKWREMIRHRWPQLKLIVARDKLDSIRGVRQKLLAYEEFLKLYPEWIDKAVLIQVCLSDVSNAELESDVTSIVERINSYQKNLAANQPVALLQQDIEFDQYLALLCEASAFAVTSLREGMNLTSHEFLYCNKQDGPLILSEFTGTAWMVGDKSLLVNPWDRRQMAEAFYQSLTMDDEEKKDRHDYLYQYVSENTGAQWVETFFTNTELAWEENQRRLQNRSRQLDGNIFNQSYFGTRNGRRIFFINLDTTVSSTSSSTSSTATTTPAASTVSSSTTSLLLTRPTTPRSISSTTIESSSKGPFYRRRSTKTPEALTSSYILPQRKITAVTELMNDPQNCVYIISSEPMHILERIYLRAGDVGLIAENGGYVRPCRSDKWKLFTDQDETNSWKAMVLSVLETIKERFSGSQIRTTDCTVTFQVDTSDLDPERTSNILGECINHINDAFEGEKVHAKLSGRNSILVSSKKISKVSASQWVYDYETMRYNENNYQNSGDSMFKFLFVADHGGDDRDDDEDLFDWANQKSPEVSQVITVATSCVGGLARWRLGGINGLLNVLLASSRSSS